MPLKLFQTYDFKRFFSAAKLGVNNMIGVDCKGVNSMIGLDCKGVNSMIGLIDRVLTI